MDDAPNDRRPDDSSPPPAPDTDRSESLGTVAKRLGPAAWLAVAWAVLPALGGFALLAFMGPTSEWLRGHAEIGILIYIAAFTICAGVGLLPTYAQAALAGFAFGSVAGTGAALAGFLGAALLGRLLAARLAADHVEAEIARHPKALAVRDALVGPSAGPWLRRLGIVTLVRVPPNSPFALTNLVLTSTGTTLPVYLLGTAIGMLPRTAAVVVIGAQVEELTSKPDQPRWLVVTGIAVTVAVILVIGHLGNKALQKATRAGQPGAGDAPAAS
ncbi:MAG: VTT domain-containing protein [Planctomycetota bacterium]